MHVKFDATVKHDTGETYFLALDKPVGQRSFIEFMNIEPVGRQKRKQEMPVELCYDVEWLAIAKANHQKMPLNAFPSSVSIKLMYVKYIPHKVIQRAGGIPRESSTRRFAE